MTVSAVNIHRPGDDIGINSVAVGFLVEKVAPAADSLRQSDPGTDDVGSLPEIKLVVAAGQIASDQST